MLVGLRGQQLPQHYVGELDREREPHYLPANGQGAVKSEVQL